MVQVIDEGTPRGPSMGQRLAGSLMNALTQGQQLYQQHQQRQAMKQLGLPENVSPEIAQLYIQEQLKGQGKEREFSHELEKQRQKYGFEKEAKAAELAGKTERETAEKSAPFQAGLDTLAQMRRLRQKGNLGFGSSITGIFSPETRRERGEYEQLGKSLISLASNIPIRNQQEFATLAEKLYDSSITDAEAEGILNAMERIITNFMGGEGIGARSDMGQAPQGKPKERPPLSSFHR